MSFSYDCTSRVRGLSNKVKSTSEHSKQYSVVKTNHVSIADAGAENGIRPDAPSGENPSLVVLAFAFAFRRKAADAECRGGVGGGMPGGGGGGGGSDEVPQAAPMMLSKATADELISLSMMLSNGLLVERPCLGGGNTVDSSIVSDMIVVMLCVRVVGDDLARQASRGR